MKIELNQHLVWNQTEVSNSETSANVLKNEIHAWRDNLMFDWGHTMYGLIPLQL